VVVAGRLLIAVLALGVIAPGCGTIRRALHFEKQAGKARQVARVEGRVETEAAAEGPLIVVLARPGESESDALVGVDTYVRVLPGSFAFSVAPGRYRLGAYEDRNQNRHLDPGERTRPLRAGALLSVGPGEVAREDLVLAADATTPPEVTESIDVLGLVARTPREQQDFSLWAWSVQGEVCADLHDARFGQASADRGLWRIMDFLNEGLAGIYFLAPYDAKRVPVLFVHGIAGTPQQFLPLIASLDTERFQPWFYFYPSGFSLDRIADHLSTLLKRLQVEHGFDELAIVAHSAGGLVSRAAILDYERETEREDVRLFLTIATPWGGQARAARAAGARVEMPRSFQDMSPSSDFLRRLFYEDEAQRNARRLGSSVEFHMLFGFRMRTRSRIANDGTVTVASQTRPEAQAQAKTQRALDAGHVDILASEETLARVTQLLGARFD
jgi:pimeloyl-ACP methyl ester carboxylesterase